MPSQLGGFLGGALASTLFYPLDILRYRAQAGDASIKWSQLVSNSRSIYSNHGWRGLYSGAGVSILGSTMAWGLYFPIYNSMKSSNLPVLKDNYLLSGFLAGVPVITLTNPLWVIKTQMALQYTENLKGLVKTIQQIKVTDGYKGFFRGYLPGVVNCWHGGVQLYFYEYLKIYHQRYTTSGEDTSTTTGTGSTSSPILEIFLTSFSLGFLSKVIATTVMYPVQTIRVRLQDQNRSYRGTFSAFKAIRSEYGLIGLYRGLGIQLLLKSPSVALIFAVYESVKGL